MVFFGYSITHATTGVYSSLGNIQPYALMTAPMLQLFFQVDIDVPPISFHDFLFICVR